MEGQELNPDDSLARNRSRREKKDKGGRFAALAKLRQAKASGEKFKYEVTEEQDVYEEVDEKTYSKIVRERQEEDWIIDDDGAGYVEDGREIFDEELGDAPAEKGNKKEKKQKNPNIRPHDSKAKNIKSMFAAVAVKPKKKVEKEVNLNGDCLLGDIMAELHQGSGTSLLPNPVKLKKKSLGAAINPFSVKSSSKKKPLASSFQNSDYGSGSASIDAKSSSPALRPMRPKSGVKKLKKMEVDNEVDSGMIEEFTSQDVMEDTLSQQIDEPSQKVEKSMDVSGIDFDDDFGNDEGVSMVNNCSGEKENFDDSMEEDVKPQLNQSRFNSGWETVKDEQPDLPTDVQVDSSKLPLTTTDTGEQVLRMYWLDAYEDYYKQPGVVYLFGKVWIESADQHVSCCVAVKNIERRVFLLPRRTRVTPKGVETNEDVTFVDVYKEFNEKIAETYKIMKFKSLKVTKDYAFELVDVPVQSEYLEVRYSAEYPALPSDLKGETFSRVFGCGTSSLETFMLDRRFKGPSWIDIKMPQIPSPAVSWCKVEAFVSKMEHIAISTATLIPPPLVVMTLNLRTLTNPKTHQNEVIAVSCLIHHKYAPDKPSPKPPFQQHFCAISKPSDCVFPFDFKEAIQAKTKSMRIEMMSNERALLGMFLAKIQKIDPDIIVGHDIVGFDLDVLLHSIAHNKIPHWSRLGRLKRANMPKLSPGFKGARLAQAACGRLICDVQISAKELMRCRSYDLSELVIQILKDKREEVDPDTIRYKYSKSADLLGFVELTLLDSSYILRLMYDLMVIPLALQITAICGNVMARTLLGGRSERNEYLLLHAFSEKQFLVPDKHYSKKPQPAVADGDDEDANQTVTKKGGRRKPAYAGGLVLEPKKGFYDKYILLLDFNSLYPSIIQEYNICFTTISKSDTAAQEDEEDLHLKLPEPDLEVGILPTEIRKLVQSRRQVKQMMKASDITTEQYMQYDIRQKALKLTANSMYGCLGFSHSRFYAKPLAALVTGKGREILMQTRDLVQNMNLDVIYGDTDSIMVNTNSTDLDAVYKLGNKIKNEVNKLYRLLEIDIDGVFKSMLLLKKKKYAALTVTKVGDKIVTQQELKGLDIVRRDWCPLAKEAGNFVVSQILSGEACDSMLEKIHGKLIEVGEKVKAGEIDVENYYITKQLTKNPEDYPDKRNLAHVQVALRMNSKGGRKLHSGDIVYYLICEDGSTLSPNQRAYHPDELSKSDVLKIDTKYYLSHQVHPVVARLVDPVDGTDSAHIAECLGLDPSSYRQSAQNQGQEEDDAMLSAGDVSDEEKYRDCDRFKWPCPQCGREIIMDSVFTCTGTIVECSLQKCPNGTCSAVLTDSLPSIQNSLTLAIRNHIRKYYEGWTKCEDSVCGLRTRRTPIPFFRSAPICTACHRGVLHPEYTDVMLYTQLCFYQYIFDTDRAILTISNPVEKVAASGCVAPFVTPYRTLYNHSHTYIKQSAYSQVNLASLFQGLFTLK